MDAGGSVVVYIRVGIIYGMAERNEYNHFVRYESDIIFGIYSVFTDPLINMHNVFIYTERHTP